MRKRIGKFAGSLGRHGPALHRVRRRRTDRRAPVGSSELVYAAGWQGQPSQRGGEDEYGAAPAADDGKNRRGAPWRRATSTAFLGPEPAPQPELVSRAPGHRPHQRRRAPHHGPRGRDSGTRWRCTFVGERAYVLMNDWYGYYGSRTRRRRAGLPGRPGARGRGISNPQNPVVTGRTQVPGSIQTSRLTRGGDKEALFVAANNWNGETKTVVRSFAVSATGKLGGADHPRPRRLRHRRPGHPRGAPGGPLRLGEHRRRGQQGGKSSTSPSPRGPWSRGRRCRPRATSRARPTWASRAASCGSPRAASGRAAARTTSRPSDVSDIHRTPCPSTRRASATARTSTPPSSSRTRPSA